MQRAPPYDHYCRAAGPLGARESLDQGGEEIRCHSACAKGGVERIREHMGDSRPDEDDRAAPAVTAALAQRTQDIYERQAKRFDAERPRVLYERHWLDRFLNLVGRQGRVLDLGCGGGDPIAGYMMTRGYEVVGVDASEAMLTIARERFPNGDWRRVDMRRLALGEAFDGIVAWDSFFHLMPLEQRSVLGLLREHMKEGAALLLTVGPEAGEVGGWVGEEPVYHASLAPTEYEAILNGLGVEIVEFVAEDPRCDGHTVLLARRVGA